MTKPSYVPAYYRLPNSDKEFLCTSSKDNGLHKCQDLPPLRSLDLSTICRNSIPPDWPLKATQPQSHPNQDRFVDGQRLPADLVSGDLGSPFLAKQMSPLIAQSVFQPALVSRHIDSLPALRQRRSRAPRDGQARNARVSARETQQNASLPSGKRRLERIKRLGSLIMAARQDINRSARGAGDAQSTNKHLTRRQLNDLEASQPEGRGPTVETNANSDSFTRRIKSRKLIDKSAKVECINWNKYYTECRAGDSNPFQGTISFDNVGMAWTAIFLVISLEGWSDIMYLLQDSHSFWVWIYFVLLIVIGSFFMINLCLVVIATQFSATKKREMERMRQERLKFSSSSTLTATSESTNCYTVIVKSIARCLRHAKQALIGQLKRRKCKQIQKRRMLERQKRSESRQVSGLSRALSTSASRPSLTDGSDQRRSIRVTSQQLRVFGAGDEMDTSPNKCQASSATGLLASRLDRKHSSARLANARAKSPEARQGSSLEQKRAAGSRKAIRLEQSRTGGGEPACRALRGSSRSSGLDASSLHSNCRHYHKCPLDEIEVSLCPNFIARSRGFREACKRFKQNVKRLVDHRYFQRLILLAILINAISMGIEYHNQPEQLTEAVEISNIVFACLFLVEMTLKLIAHGLYDYVIDGFNCFDGCIVILSILELFESSSGSGLSVLRTFRLLRILKLVRFMPALRRQLLIMLRTLDNVAVFFALLVLFIFIFSILGMNLFGCKFCETLPDGTERCDRKNFNSLLWSLVTVFQILTQEDWNVGRGIQSIRIRA